MSLPEIMQQLSNQIDFISEKIKEAQESSMWTILALVVAFGFAIWTIISKLKGNKKEKWRDRQLEKINESLNEISKPKNHLQSPQSTSTLPPSVHRVHQRFEETLRHLQLEEERDLYQDSRIGGEKLVGDTESQENKR